MIPARPTAITNATRTILPAPIESHSESKQRENDARLAAERSSISDHRARRRRHWHPVEAHTFVPEQRDALNLPPPTMNTDAVSGTLPVHRYATTGAT